MDSASNLPPGRSATTIPSAPAPRLIPYRPPRCPDATMLQRGREFLALMRQRRSVRSFAPDPVPRELIELAIASASTAPSGAHRQPWRFVVVGDAPTKRRLRLAAEAEERRFYEGGRAPEAWLAALAPLGTSWQKPYLEIAPWLVVVFAEHHTLTPTGQPSPNYYVKESVGMACGLFVAALHHMGLATLPHTPSPMGFLADILQRPEREKPYILFPVGHPAADASVPDLQRKALDQVAVWHGSPSPPPGPASTDGRLDHPDPSIAPSTRPAPATACTG
ncbi:MAG: nitroreductase family protein [Verrucomicrobiales bacterium]|nr:nitroreductase family protein [Verrucomicrobiales bacterium]